MSMARRRCGTVGGRRRRSNGGRARLALLFLSLVAVNAYVFFFSGGTSIQDVMRASAIGGRRLAVAPHEAHTERAPKPSFRGSMRGSIALSKALLKAGLTTTQANEIIVALRPKLNLRRLQPNHSFAGWTDDNGRVERFVFHISPVLRVELKRSRGGRLTAKRIEAKLATKIVRLGGRIVSSLNRAMASAGASPALVGAFVELFSWDVNWYVDPRDGDSFRLIAEQKLLAGKFYRYGKILAAEYTGRKGRFSAFYFDSGGSGGKYYSVEGYSVRRSFLKTPLRYRRVSSRYNLRRMHPILGRMKKHRGVDYAAVRGTPIWASADGVVRSARRSGGAGKMVVIRHRRGVSTLYMHLDRFARGVRPGVRVAQRQVIGYVGSTGLATGPHLHYEIRLHGRPVNPLTYQARRGARLPAPLRQRFAAQIKDRRAALEGIPIDRVASRG